MEGGALPRRACRVPGQSLPSPIEPAGRWCTIRVFPSPEGLTIYTLESSEGRSSAAEMEAVLRQSQRQRRLATVLAETNEAVLRAESPE